MQNYKDTNNQIHVLDSTKFQHLLPDGCIAITQAEADVIQAAAIIPLTYSELRAAAYPNFMLYLDGIVKGDTGQIQAYIDNCLAVKLQYPKS